MAWLLKFSWWAQFFFFQKIIAKFKMKKMKCFLRDWPKPIGSHFGDTCSHFINAMYWGGAFSLGIGAC